MFPVGSMFKLLVVSCHLYAKHSIPVTQLGVLRFGATPRDPASIFGLPAPSVSKEGSRLSP